MATSTVLRTPTIRLAPVRLIPTVNSSSNKSLKLSFAGRQKWPKRCCKSYSPPHSHTYSRDPVWFLCFNSNGETLVTDEEEEIPEFQENSEGANTEDDASEGDNDEVDESPSSILASLQMYKEAIVNNDESKIAEIEVLLKSIEDEKIVLETKLTTSLDELSNAKDRVLRISADFDNFRKRTERDRLSFVSNAQGEVVEKLLPVIDNFERAKSQIKVETEKEEQINNSYQSIYKQFVEVLKALGVVPVETVGNPFDPQLHEAIMREDSTEFGDGIVLQEFRKGFILGERLLRPAMVKVSAGPGPANPGSKTVKPSQEAESVEMEDVEEGQSEPAPAQD